MSRRGPTRPRRTGAAGCPASWRSATVRPVRKQQLKSRLPGFPVVRVSPAFREFPPGRTSALAVTEFVLWAGELAQGFPASNFKIFPGYPRNPQESACYPPGKVTVHRGSTGWSTGRPHGQPTGRGACLSGPGPGACRSRSWCMPVPVLAGRRWHRGGNAARSNEAPPRMRWRGLATAIQQGHRLLGYRGAVRPDHRGGKISPEGQFPGSPRAREDGPVSRAAGVRGSS